MRQCSRELKRILKFMEERDEWLVERREQARAKRHREVKFMNTLKGRQAEKKRIEDNEFQRLRNIGPPLTSTQIHPSNQGRDKVPTALERKASTASSSSNIERPLMTLLGKHTRPMTSDYASTEAADGAKNVSIASDAANFSQILDIPDERTMSFDGTFIHPGKVARGQQTKNDILRVMKDMYVLMQETMRIGQARDKSNEAVIKVSKPLTRSQCLVSRVLGLMTDLKDKHLCQVRY